MQNSHGQVVSAPRRGRRCSEQDEARWEPTRSVYKVLCSVWRTEGGGCPPVPLPGADADVFAQREHLSLSWIQPVHTYCSRDALHRFEIRAPRSCACPAHSSSLHHRLNCCSAAATGQVAPNNPCELYSTDILEYSNNISPSHSSGCPRIFLGHHTD